MNPQLTITVLSVLLIANCIVTLVYRLMLKRMKDIAEINQQYSDKWHQLTLQQTERVREWRVANEELQSKLNAAKDALK